MYPSLQHQQLNSLELFLQAHEQQPDTTHLITEGQRDASKVIKGLECPTDEERAGEGSGGSHPRVLIPDGGVQRLFSAQGLDERHKMK